MDLTYEKTKQNLPLKDNGQHFILQESTTQELQITKRSPFAIPKGILGIAGTVSNVKKLRSGQILVECSKKTQMENLLRATELAGVKMKATLHPFLNSTKGVIRTSELEGMEDSELAKEMSVQGVTNVK